MYSRITFFTLAFCLLLCSCSTDSPQSAEKTASQEVIQVIQNLDSLNQQIEESTLKIEQNIQSVENAVNELDDFE